MGDKAMQKLGHVVCEFGEWVIEPSNGAGREGRVVVECIGQTFEEMCYRAYLADEGFTVTQVGDGTMLPTRKVYHGTEAIGMMLEWFTADEVVALLNEWKTVNNVS